MLDSTPEKIDNVLEAIPQQKGRSHKIRKDELPEGITPCKNHIWKKDETETHEFMQGYLCKTCGFGELRRIQTKA